MLRSYSKYKVQMKKKKKRVPNTILNDVLIPAWLGGDGL